jgi:hypothetical protein
MEVAATGGGGGGPQFDPRTVEAVFRDFKGRRAGLIKALTSGLSFSLNSCFSLHFDFLFYFLVF